MTKEMKMSEAGREADEATWTLGRGKENERRWTVGDRSQVQPWCWPEDKARYLGLGEDAMEVDGMDLREDSVVAKAVMPGLAEFAHHCDWTCIVTHEAIQSNCTLLHISQPMQRLPFTADVPPGEQVRLPSFRELIKDSEELCKDIELVSVA